MLVIKNGTSVKIEPKCNFWFSLTLDDTNWNKTILGPSIKRIIADEDTVLFVLDSKVINGRVSYLVELNNEKGWVNDSLLISSLYGREFFWKIYSPIILKKAS